MLRQHGQRQLPDDAAFRVGEAVELVHDDGRDLLEIERLRMQQAIEQNLGDDDEDAGVRIDAAIAGDEADVVGLKPQRTADACISRNFCSVSAISGVV